jgi:hypothetical protein
MEMQQTHYYTTGTATLPWKCNITHRYTTGTVSLLWKCHQGLIYHNTITNAKYKESYNRIVIEFQIRVNCDIKLYKSV